ncbi:MAG: MglA protein, partial [Myxococcota bacterium]
MQFNSAQRELVLKVVYYGPPLSGKTTNLQALHRLLNPELCGRLTTLDTANDRTLFFDLLPLSMKTRTGYRIKIKLFTVP